jgi:hypothetical protein
MIMMSSHQWRKRVGEWRGQGRRHDGRRKRGQELYLHRG